MMREMQKVNKISNSLNWDWVITTQKKLHKNSMTNPDEYDVNSSSGQELVNSKNEILF